MFVSRVAMENLKQYERLQRMYVMSARISTGGCLCRRMFVSRVAMENLKLYERLQRVRPSPDTSAATLRKEWSSAQQYRQNCAKFKPSERAKSPRRGGAHGGGRRRVQLAGGGGGAAAVAVPTTAGAV